MRSRLEADYAQFLDSKSWPWTYEPQCFAGPDGQWLPDFRCLIDHNVVYVEVKPATSDPQIVETAQAYLKRMPVVWLSEPGAYVRLTFWSYGGPARLELTGRPDGHWRATWASSHAEFTTADEAHRFLSSAEYVPAPASSTQTLKERWPTIVGADMGAHTTPGGLAGHTLTIYADSTAWATQTRLLAAALLPPLNAVFGPNSVHRIKVRRGG
jgi:hypothetical protein